MPKNTKRKQKNSKKVNWQKVGDSYGSTWDMQRCFFLQRSRGQKKKEKYSKSKKGSKVKYVREIRLRSKIKRNSKRHWQT